MDNLTRHALELTVELCSQPSISAEARALSETADCVERLLIEAGFSTSRLVANGGAPAVYGELRGDAPYTLLLYNHYDVQPIDPIELWTSPPFEPAMREGRLYARGTADNKGEIAARLAAIHAVIAARGRLPFTLRWIIEGEEEIGSPSFEQLAREHAQLLRADACFWEGSVGSGDGRPVITLGYKGLLAVRLTVRELSGDAHSGLASVLPSAAWRLIEVLRDLRRPDGTVLIPGFYDGVRPATEDDLRAIDGQGDGILMALRDGYGPAAFVGGVDGSAARERISFAPTCNIAGFQTGYTGPGLKTVLPREATAQLDFRLVRDQNPDRIFDALAAHLKATGNADVELQQLASARPVATPPDDPLVERVKRIAEASYGAPAKILPSSPATQPILDALRRHVGVVGLAAPDNPPHQASAIHAPDEHIRIEELRQATAFFAATLLNLHLETER